MQPLLLTSYHIHVRNPHRDDITKLSFSSAPTVIIQIFTALKVFLSNKLGKAFRFSKKLAKASPGKWGTETPKRNTLLDGNFGEQILFFRIQTEFAIEAIFEFPTLCLRL